LPGNALTFTTGAQPAAENPPILSAMETTVISLIALALLVYLVVAVLRPEKF
jgi:K+-transporting ATPase KdpF subunit